MNDNFRIKLRNPNKGATGIKLSSGLERTVKGGAPLYLKPEEVEFILTTSKKFAKKLLVIENYDDIDSDWLQMVGLEEKEEVTTITDKEIEEALEMKNEDFEKFVGVKINSRLEKNKLFQVAKDSDDVSKGKMRIIELVTGYSFDLEDDI